MKQSESKKIVALATQFVDLLKREDYTGISALLNNFQAVTTPSEIELYIKDLADDESISDIDYAIVDAYGYTQVQVMFETCERDEVVCLSIRYDGDDILIYDIEWGYPDWLKCSWSGRKMSVSNWLVDAEKERDIGKQLNSVFEQVLTVVEVRVRVVIGPKQPSTSHAARYTMLDPGPASQITDARRSDAQAHAACARVLTLRGLALHDRGAVGSCW
jgi:hypothetical protein